MLKVKTVARQGPLTAHHASAVAHGQVFVHGGVNELNSNKPLCQLYRFDPNTATWTLMSDDGPTLSHHAAWVSEDRFVHFVGGWNGRARSCEIYTFDSRHNVWIGPVNTDGFPVGGGLSSHTVSALNDGRALIVGRLGGLRTQRRTSAVIEVKGDHKRLFEYKMQPVTVSSRAGHTATPVGRDKLLVVGGRFEPHRTMSVEMMHYEGIRYHGTDTFKMKEAVGEPYKDTGRNIVVCRRYHASAQDREGRVLVHAGEAFDQLHPRDSDPLCDLAVWLPAASRFSNAPSSAVIEVNSWHAANVQDSNKIPMLAAHSLVCVDDALIALGGFTRGWAPNEHTYQFKVTLGRADDD